MNIININERIMAHKEKLISEGIDEKHILGIFLYGSQNYHKSYLYSLKRRGYF